jgi:hypothetical protein
VLFVKTVASHLFVLVVCCTMLVAFILVTSTFTIQNAGRTQEILFVLPKGTFAGNLSAMWGMKLYSSGHFHLAVLVFLVRERVCVPKSR